MPCASCSRCSTRLKEIRLTYNTTDRSYQVKAQATGNPSCIQVIHHDSIGMGFPGQDNDLGLTHIQICPKDLYRLAIADLVNR